MEFIDNISSQLKKDMKNITSWQVVAIVTFLTIAFIWGFGEGKSLALHHNTLEKVK